MREQDVLTLRLEAIRDGEAECETGIARLLEVCRDTIEGAAVKEADNIASVAGILRASCLRLSAITKRAIDRENRKEARAAS